MQKTTRPIRKKKVALTPKQKLVKESAVKREKIERLVFVWQEKLFSQAKVKADVLERATLYLQPKTFTEIVEERNVQSWCGYPLCDQSPQDLLKYRISISQQKVFDQSERTRYCSDSCFSKAKYYVLQLSEEPVWFRDLNSTPKAHIISLEHDFETAIQEQRESKTGHSSQELKQNYVQHLIKTVPNQDIGSLSIVEKESSAPTAAPEVTSFDTLEGYRIEITQDGGKIPTSIVLDKKPTKKLPEETSIDPTSEEDLFRTMMMLKEMELDRPDSLPPTVSQSRIQTDTRSGSSLPNMSSAPAESSMSTMQHATPAAAQVTQTKKTGKKKKKKAMPELSLFGAIWTMLDHMTTLSTRTYLHDLERNQRRSDVMTLLKQEKRTLDETHGLRGHILSERILETYQLIRVQLCISDTMEDDIVNVIKTFNLSDANMVAPDPAQCYMLTLVIVKALADILLDSTSWKPQFESCCQAIDQSSDTIDACVRVLKVASV